MTHLKTFVFNRGTIFPHRKVLISGKGVHRNDKIKGKGIADRPTYTEEQIDAVNKRQNPNIGIKNRQRLRPIRLML